MVTGKAVSYRQLALPPHSNHRQRLAARYHTEPLRKDAWMGSKRLVWKTRLHQQQVDEALQQVLHWGEGSRFAERSDVST